MHRKLAALAVVLTLAGGTTPAHATPARRAAVITTTEESYGPDPLQVVTIRRHTSSPSKTVFFIHGGGWNAGGRGSVNDLAIGWAAHGWTTINVSYRLGVLDGTPDDGKHIIGDVETVLAEYRAASYVDPTRIVLYGESAGAHLATLVGAVKGSQVAATIGISPIPSTGAAIADTSSAKAISLGDRAREFFGYSTGTTSAGRYVDRAGPMFLVWSEDEWVTPAGQGVKLCAQLGARCTSTVYPGDLHGGAIVDAHPEVVDAARLWADRMVTE